MDLSPGPKRASPGGYVLTLSSPPKHPEQTVVLVTRHISGVGEIQAYARATNGDIEIINFDGANVPADTQFSIAVYEVPLST
jgi:hypothetical protein